MDTPIEDHRKFDHVTCLIGCTTDVVLSSGSLSVDVIEQVRPFLFDRVPGDFKS